MSDQYEARISSQGVLQFEGVDTLGNENLFDIDEEDFLDVYPLTARQRLLYNWKRYGIRIWKRFQCLPRWKKMLVMLMGLIGFQAAFIMVFFHKQILKKVVQVSKELNSRWYTPFIFISLIFGVSFPPLIGFSLLSTSVGLVYGITLKGWLIISFGAVSGSIAAFIVYKTVLQSYAERLVRWNDKFEALASILQDNDSYWLIALIRLCPFPYSLTNGAMAGIYGISVRNFSIAQIITTPKLVIYLFIGSRIKNIGETDSTTAIIFDIVGIIITAISLAVTTSLLYYKTKSRYMELQRRGDDPFANASF